jgi:Uma2 family endonuclease
LTDSTRRVSPDEFQEYCRLNPELRLELTAQGELVIMSPTGNDAGDQNAELTHQLRAWSKKDGRGRSFDSSTGFTLPNGAILSPDASWILKSRHDSLSVEMNEIWGEAP